MLRTDQLLHLLTLVAGFLELGSEVGDVAILLHRVDDLHHASISHFLEVCLLRHNVCNERLELAQRDFVFLALLVHRILLVIYRVRLRIRAAARLEGSQALLGSIELPLPILLFLQLGLNNLSSSHGQTLINLRVRTVLQVTIKDV